MQMGMSSREGCKWRIKFSGQDWKKRRGKLRAQPVSKQQQQHMLAHVGAV